MTIETKAGWTDGGGPRGTPDLAALFIMAASFKLMDIAGTAATCVGRLPLAQAPAWLAALLELALVAGF